MRNKWILSALAMSVLALAMVAWQSAGQNQGKGNARVNLPIRQVVLFNSGVSYLQREGEVEGNAQIDLAFPTSDVNDLLKSMVLEDTGNGKISTVSYDSHDPVEKVLRSFALDLNDNPTLAQILNQARGEKIEVQHSPPADKKGAAQGRVTGIIVGMELHKKTVEDSLQDEAFLNLLSEAGLQSIPLDKVAAIRFLNPILESEFQRALRVVASSHDMQKKAVTVNFKGQGKRNVRVGYVVEHPIWKTSYRLQLEPGGKVFMQGWAIVENTSDDDWNDIQLTLVSGRPISFKMDLYQPLYVPRPTVEPELFASLRPQVYGGDISKKFDKAEKMAEKKEADLEEERMAAKDAAPKEAKALKKKLDKLNKLTSPLMDLAAAKTLDFKQVASLASASELGEYYQYAIDQKITLPRQKSAMIPILNQTIAADRVSIYNESVQPKYPLLGLRLKNSAGKPLNQGPITVYEDGSYAGDTRILDLSPNEERLLSYAVDQAVEIKSDVKTTPSPDMNFKIGEGNLTAHYKLRETRTYTIKNRGTKERTVLIEHPIRDDWKLVDPKQAAETTRDLCRFQITVPADKTVSYDVVEENARTDGVAWNGQPYYVAQTGIAVKAETTNFPAKLLSLKLHKGLALPTLKERVSKTYSIQNNSDLARSFTIDHIIPAEWVRLGEDGETQRGPGVFRFVLKVPQGKTGSREVIEERRHEEKPVSVRGMSDEKLAEYLNNPAPSPDVKAGLAKVLNLRTKLAQTSKDLADKEKQLKELSDDQARLRENLKIVPPNTDPARKFLDKFVAQESDIENYQKQIRQLQATVAAQQRELDVTIANLTAE